MLLKVCYGNAQTFKMLGEQIPCIFIGPSYVSSLCDIIKDRLENSMLVYDYRHEDVSFIQLLIYKVDYTDKVKKASKGGSSPPADSSDNTDLINLSKFNSRLVLNKLVPLSMDLSDYKKGLTPLSSTEKARVIERNSLKSDNCEIYKKDMYTIVITKSSTDENKQQNDVSIYSDSGFKVTNFTDVEIDKNKFVRKTSNVYNTIYNGVVTKSRVSIPLAPVRGRKTSKRIKNLIIPDPHIGSFDLETYRDQGVSKVYSLGYYTKTHGVKIFYIDKESLDSDKLIIKCIDSMLENKYSGFTFYVHNLGLYDIVFLLSPLLKAKKEDESPKYKFKPVCRDDLMLSFTITKQDNRKLSIKFVDSLNLLNHPLEKLCNTYNTEVTKGLFPYDFVSKKTLFYEGEKPPINCFSKNVEVIEKDYNLIPLDNWSTELETIKYLEKDLVSLYQVIEKFSGIIYDENEIQVTQSLTISSLAMKIYLKNFYKNNVALIIFHGYTFLIRKV
uniref:Probable DNA polymerase n=1 Tax=Cladonia subtenuis TaxID=195789 RepID=A0A385GNM5_9LECA|nr:DNA polymerase type B2 [Cladonia subtenuis]AXX76245.1 DNA polymerase type B2 [Cladonia subtenuis]WBP63544.1 DNA polymerase type B2 [Cladonia subtenuis]